MILPDEPIDSQMGNRNLHHSFSFPLLCTSGWLSPRLCYPSLSMRPCYNSSRLPIDTETAIALMKTAIAHTENAIANTKNEASNTENAFANTKNEASNTENAFANTENAFANTENAFANTEFAHAIFIHTDCQYGICDRRYHITARRFDKRDRVYRK
jgi:septal ring factor EnvC (AmiA/AmiB activator)